MKLLWLLLAWFSVRALSKQTESAPPVKRGGRRRLQVVSSVLLMVASAGLIIGSIYLGVAARAVPVEWVNVDSCSQQAVTLRCQSDTDPAKSFVLDVTALTANSPGSAGYPVAVPVVRTGDDEYTSPSRNVPPVVVGLAGSSYIPLGIAFLVLPRAPGEAWWKKILFSIAVVAISVLGFAYVVITGTEAYGGVILSFVVGLVTWLYRVAGETEKSAQGTKSVDPPGV